MNTNNDPILSLLLDGVTDPAEREIIISAQATFNSAGPNTLAGAMAIYQARLIKVVIQCAEKTMPSAAHQETLVALRKELEQLRQVSLPAVHEAKEEIVAINRSTRRLRMSIVSLFLLIALLVGAAAGGYGYHWYEQRLPLLAEELALIKKLNSQHIFFLKADDQEGKTGICIVSNRAHASLKRYEDKNGFIGFQAWWEEEQESAK